MNTSRVKHVALLTTVIHGKAAAIDRYQNVNEGDSKCNMIKRLRSSSIIRAESPSNPLSPIPFDFASCSAGPLVIALQGSALEKKR